MKMHKILFAGFILFTIMMSCSEEDDYMIESSRLAIKFEDTTEGNIKIIWNKPKMDNIVKYVLIRTTEEKDNDYYNQLIEYIMYNSYYYYDTDEIISFSPFDENEYVDQPGLSSEYYYKMFAYNSDGISILSNTLKYTQDGFTKLEFYPSDAKYSTSENKIVFKANDNQSLYVYDCATRQIVAEKKFNASVNFLNIGNAGSGEEIYIPRSDGILTILNFELEEKHSVNIGDQIVSVCCGDNLIFVSSYGYNNSSMHSISREDLSIKSTVSRDSYYSAQVSCLYADNVILNIGNYYIYKYYYDAQGNFSYNNEYMQLTTDYRIMESFPNGAGVIFGDRGYIFGSSISSYYRLNSYNFSDFTISSEYIYALRQSYKAVSIYSLKGEEQGQISTVLYPRIICGSNSNMFVIGTESENWYNDDFYIEKVLITSK